MKGWVVMNKTKQFPLRVVLTASTGRLLTKARGPHDNGIGDLYEILNWMTGDNLFTHQLPRAGDACKPVLLAAFPELAKANDALNLLDQGLEMRESNEAIEHWLTQIQMIAPEIKETYDVPRIAEWTHINPVLEAQTMVGKDKVIVV